MAKEKTGSFQTEGYLFQGTPIYEALLVLSGLFSGARGRHGGADAVPSQADGLCGGSIIEQGRVDFAGIFQILKLMRSPS